LSVNYISYKFAKFGSRKGKTQKEGPGRLRRNKFKWILFITNSCSWVSLIVCLMIWFDMGKHADVIINPEELPDIFLSIYPPRSSIVDG